MTLDQDLMEIEPILRSTDGTFQFNHPSFQEVLTAKQFADEINFGRLSVRDAYVNFWSYEEDAELWGLPKDREWRALLPGWRNVLLMVVPLLKRGKDELTEVLNKSYFLAEKRISTKNYNPFFSDLMFAAEVIGKSEIEDDIDCSRLGNAFIREFTNEDKRLYCLYSLGYLSFGEDLLIGHVLSRMTAYRNVAARFLVDIGSQKGIPALIDFVKQDCEKHMDWGSISLHRRAKNVMIPYLIDYLKDKSNLDREYVVEILGEARDSIAVPVLIDYLSTTSNRNRWWAAIALGKIGYRNKDTVDALFEYACNPKNTNNYAAVEAIGAICATEDLPLILYFADSTDPYVRSAANVALGGIKNNEARKILTSRLQIDNSTDQQSAIEGLSKNITSETVIYLERYINNPQSKHIDEAIDVLANTGSMQAEKVLTKYVKENDSLDVKHAIEALVNIGSKTSISAVFEYLRNPLKKHRYTAVYALSESHPEEVLEIISNIPIIYNGENITDKCRSSVLKSMALTKEVREFYGYDVKGNGRDRLRLFLERPQELHTGLSNYDAILNLHEKLKPQGYNPPVKKLLT